jgi:hypothetical protein
MLRSNVSCKNVITNFFVNVFWGALWKL